MSFEKACASWDGVLPRDTGGEEDWRSQAQVTTVMP